MWGEFGKGGSVVCHCGLRWIEGCLEGGWPCEELLPNRWEECEHRKRENESSNL